MAPVNQCLKCGGKMVCPACIGRKGGRRKSAARIERARENIKKASAATRKYLPCSKRERGYHRFIKGVCVGCKLTQVQAKI